MHTAPMIRTVDKICATSEIKTTDNPISNSLFQF